MTLIRLQKFLSSAGVCSRRKGEELIKNGFITVNKAKGIPRGTKVDIEKDIVEFNGIPVEINQKLIYIALNKPMGYITSCHQKGRKIVMDLLEIPERVFPVGRLDKDSVGLLLLTNDGGLHHRLSHPSFDHEKEYIVNVEKPISKSQLKTMSEGMIIQGDKTRPATVKSRSQDCFSIILKEGKKRQIRRMVKELNNKVVSLKRIRFSNIKLGNLEEKSWRYLTEKEIMELTSTDKKKLNHHIQNNPKIPIQKNTGYN